MMSKCTVSPTTSPSRPTVGSPAPRLPTARARAGLAAHLDLAAKARDRTRPQFQRRFVRNQLAALGVVFFRQQRLDRHLHEIGIAVERFAVGIGELGRFDLQVDEIRAGRIEAVEIEAFEQRQLLQQHRALAPDAGLAHRVAAIVVTERRLDLRLPARHVGAGQHAAMALAGDVHDILRAAERVDRLGDKALRPRLAGALDLPDAVAARAFGLAQDAGVGFGERGVAKQRARLPAPCRPADRSPPKSASARETILPPWRWWRWRARPADGRCARRQSPARARRPAAWCRSRATAASRSRTSRARRRRAIRCPAPCRGRARGNARWWPPAAPALGRR